MSSVKCFEHIFEPSPNELAGGMVTAEPCIEFSHRIIPQGETCSVTYKNCLASAVRHEVLNDYYGTVNSGRE